MADVESQLKRAVKWFAASLGSTKVEVDGIAERQLEQQALLERLARDVATLNARLDHVLEGSPSAAADAQVVGLQREVRQLERSVRTLRTRTEGR
ncbi:MAG: hypothetical protein ACKO04_02505 [Actinomycetes bacterium]